ncbi:HIT family protein [Nanoarchaeota archaeon]
MMECLFCKIIKGEVPSNKVYEDDLVYCFLDIMPVNRGHTLVIPKEHCENIFECSDESLSAMIKAVKKVGEAVKNAVNADGINLGMNNGKAAGQLVFHAHMHIIPRLDNDGLKHWPQKKVSKHDLEEDSRKIKDEL